MVKVSKITLIGFKLKKRKLRSKIKQLTKIIKKPKVTNRPKYIAQLSETKKELRRVTSNESFYRRTGEFYFTSSKSKAMKSF